MSGRNRWPEIVSALAVGLVVGAALGLLFAPKSGEETRDYLLDSAKEGLDAVVSQGQKWTGQAQKAAKNAKENVRSAAEAGKQAPDEATDS
jgi:gas vesicle protein